MSGWENRIAPDGRRCREREKPGQPNIVERQYLEVGSDQHDRFRVYAGPDALRLRDRGRPLPSPASAHVSEQRGALGRPPGWDERLTATRRRLQTPPLVPRIVKGSAWRLGDKPVAVRLIREARRQLARAEYDAGVEVGGALFGFWDGYERRLTICDLVAAGRGSSSRVEFDLDYIDRMRVRHWETTGWRLCGCWHSHPTWDGVAPGEVARPSTQDLRAWRSSWDVHAGDTMPVYCGLIVSEPRGSEHGSGWQYPAINAWVLDEADGDVVAREARVEVDGEWER